MIKHSKEEDRANIRKVEDRKKGGEYTRMRKDIEKGREKKRRSWFLRVTFVT